MDSHADSPVVGSEALIIRTHDKKVKVNGFTKSLGTKTVDVVDAALAYECEFTGNIYILIVRNALYFKEMGHNLLAPFIMRLAGLEVNEQPKFMTRKPTICHHSLYFPSKDIRLPLSIKGIVSYLHTRKPTLNEYSNIETHLELTPPFSEWDPHNPSYGVSENSMLDYEGNINTPKDNQEEEEGIGVVGVSSIMTEISSTLEPWSLSSALKGTYGISGVKSGKIRYAITEDELVERWGIRKEEATATILATTQRLVRSLLEPTLNRRYNTNDRMLRYYRIQCDMYMDTYFAANKLGPSIRGHTCAQLFVTDFGWCKVKPMKLKSELPLALKSLFKEDGVPEKIICDGAAEQVGGDSKRLCQLSDCTIQQLERGTPWANRAEGHVGIIKNTISDDLKISNCPMVLWCYASERRSKILSSTSRNIYSLGGKVPATMMTGRETDISALAETKWYEWIYYRDSEASFPYPTERLGRCLGPCDHKGNAMSQYVLNDQGNVLPYQTFRRLTKEEQMSQVELEKRNRFDSVIRSKLGDSITPPPEPIQQDEPSVSERESVPDIDKFDNFDEYINAELMLPKDGKTMAAAKVIRRSTGSDGKVHGKFNSNKMLDTRIYDVMFMDGKLQQLAANRIALSMYENVDSEGFTTKVMDQVQRHRKTDQAVGMEDAFTKDARGRKTRRITTKGWDFLIKWKDGSESWIPLADMKEYNPLDIAEYATYNKIEKEPAFAWWVPHAIKKRNNIISAVASRIRIKDMKYGIRIPQSITEAYELDKANGDTAWRDAVSKEMKNVSVAFDVLEDGKNPSAAHKRVFFHMIYDIKMDFTRKARLVAEGCRTPDPVNSTYAGVVSRESVRIALTYAALNDLDVYAADVQNAYLQAPCSEKYFTVMGPEFGSEYAGRKAIIVRAAYGLKSAGADFRNHLRDCMDHLGYESCKADPDVWMRKATRSDGETYYEYLLLYVDDCLCVSEDPKDALLQLDKYFPMKPDSLGPPKIYLGGKVSKVQLPNGVSAWAFSSSQYVHEAIRAVEEQLEREGKKLQAKKPGTPIPTSYSPELYITPELLPIEASYYQSLIGILRWIVELGRIDICHEVSLMSSQLALPREGHLDKVLVIFAYLKWKHNARMVFDPTYPTINHEDFVNHDWTTHYGNVKELLPPNAPEAHGKGFEMVGYVDADLAGEKLTRRSRTGFIIYLNQAPIYWYSKRQNGVECSTFGSEFMAMKTCCEYIRGLRYKLRMMGIPVEGSTYIYGDNQSVLCNTTNPDSTLKKKNHAIAFHFVREGVAREEWMTGYIPSDHNTSDTLTKTVPAGEKRDRLVGNYLYDM